MNSTLVSSSIALFYYLFKSTFLLKLSIDAGKVYRALSAVFSHDTTLQDELIRELGFVIKEVRVSPDHAKAFILWDSYTGQAKETTRALQKFIPRIRAGVAKALAARSVPRLEFRLDQVSEDDVQMERIFSQIDYF